MTYLNVSHFRVRHEHVCNALLRSPAGVSRDCVDVNQNVIGKFLGGASGRKLQGFVGFRREFGALLGKKKDQTYIFKKTRGKWKTVDSSALLYFFLSMDKRSLIEQTLTGPLLDASRIPPAFSFRSASLISCLWPKASLVQLSTQRHYNNKYIFFK